MKYIVFVFVLSFAPLAFAQEKGEINRSIELEKGVATVGQQNDLEKEAEKPRITPKAEKGTNPCVANQVKYLESASRKLYRAISGKGYKIKKIDLDALIVADQRFAVYTQKDGKVISLLNPSHPYGYVAIDTTRGHVVTKLKWKGCRPVATTIVAPRVAVPSVDMEPFKYWGLRVLWTLPNRFEKTKNIKESLTKIIKAD